MPDHYCPVCGSPMDRDDRGDFCPDCNWSPKYVFDKDEYYESKLQEERDGERKPQGPCYPR